MKELCLEGCKLQEFVGGKFYCTYYEENLLSEMGAGGDISKIIVFRCPQCIKEGKVGVDQESNHLEGIRKTLVYLGDHFYSFKDSFEEDLAELYRNLKALEEIKKKGD